MSVIPNTENRKHDRVEPAAPPLGSLASKSPTSAYHRWKGVLDRVLAALLLIPGLPLISMLVLLVRLTSRGPGIYRQARVGKGGRTFRIYKIRTMAHNAEAEIGPTWTRENDPRITPVGRVLRKLHLDELPQLFNVLKGEMSLVGPRPERPEFVHVLAKEIPGYLERLAIRPGVTGLAQINLPPDTDLESVRRKLVLDLEYCQTGNFFLDGRMLLCTSLRLLGFSGERAAHLMRVHRTVQLSAGNGRAGLHQPTPAGLASQAGCRECDLAEGGSATDDADQPMALPIEARPKPR